MYGTLKCMSVCFTEKSKHRILKRSVCRNQNDYISIKVNNLLSEGNLHEENNIFFTLETVESLFFASNNSF